MCAPSIAMGTRSFVDFGPLALHLVMSAAHAASVSAESLSILE